VRVDAAGETLHAFAKFVLEGLRRHVVGVAVQILTQRAYTSVAKTRRRIRSTERGVWLEAGVLQCGREDADCVVVSLREALIAVGPTRVGIQVELRRKRSRDVGAHRLALERLREDLVVGRRI